jgi:HAD superfamily hydrolase (TIGR01509 family)
MRPRLVIFDCDGILVDTEGLANRRISQLLTEAGYPVTYEECRKNYSGRSLASLQKEVEATGFSFGYSFVDRWYAELPTLFAEGVEEIPFVRDFIERLRAENIAYCVASSARVEKMHMTLGSTGLLPYVEDVLFSATMVANGKPFPDLFLHAARSMGFSPEESIVIEDAVPGVKAGVAAGMRVFAYHGDPHSDREGLEQAGGILFDDMRKLADLIPLDR